MRKADYDKRLYDPRILEAKRLYNEKVSIQEIRRITGLNYGTIVFHTKISEEDKPENKPLLEEIAKEKGFASYEESENFELIKERYLTEIREAKIPGTGYCLEKVVNDKGTIIITVSKREKDNPDKTIEKDFKNSLNRCMNEIGIKKKNVQMFYEEREIFFQPTDLDSRAFLEAYKSVLEKDFWTY